MKLSGHLEVFKNENGYLTGVMKSFDFNGKKPTGKVYIDVRIGEDNLKDFKKGSTYTLNLKEAYLDAIHVDCEKPFTKSIITVKEYEVFSIFTPEKAVKKPTKKGGK